jgi:hypothetical protein
MSWEIYATPILLGCTLFVSLRRLAPDFAFSGVLAPAVSFVFQAVVIRDLEMPAWLTSRDGSSDEGCRSH